MSTNLDAMALGIAWDAIESGTAGEYMRGLPPIRICKLPEHIESVEQVYRWSRNLMPITWTVLQDIPGVLPGTFQQMLQKSNDLWIAEADADHLHTETARLANLRATMGDIDGPGGILGQTEMPTPGNQHTTMTLDVGEVWRAEMTPVQRGILAWQTILHEAGHFWGVLHGPPGCMMQPTLNTSIWTLQAWDKEQMRKLYGPRKVISVPAPAPEPKPNKPTGGKPMDKSKVYETILYVLKMAKMAAVMTATTADDKILDGLIELVEMLSGDKVSHDELRAFLDDHKATA